MYKHSSRRVRVMASECDLFERGVVQIQCDFAGMFEVDRDAMADGALHLAQSPVGLIGIANPCPWRDKRCVFQIHGSMAPMQLRAVNHSTVTTNRFFLITMFA